MSEKIRQRAIRDTIIMANAGGEEELLTMFINQNTITESDINTCDLPPDYERGRNQLKRIIHGLH